MRRRIVFAGTPIFGLGCLEALFESHDICAVYTQPDRPAGRGQKLMPSPIKAWALEHQIPVYQPEHFKDPNTVSELAALAADVMIVIAYGLILPAKVLALPKYGCINVHASLLPRWRGAAPIQYAILHGDNESGVTIMQMDAGLDTGGMYEKVHCTIGSTETAGQLHDKLADLAIMPLLNTLQKLDELDCKAEAQDTRLASYASKIEKSHAKINWHQSAAEIDCQIRAFNPWPIAFTDLGEQVLRVHSAKIVHNTAGQVPGSIIALDKEGLLVATAEGAILIERLQFPGGKAMAVRDWLNAPRQGVSVGMVLA